MPTNEYVLQYEVSLTAYEANESLSKFLELFNLPHNDNAIYKLYDEAVQSYKQYDDSYADEETKKRLQEIDHSARFSDLITVIDDYPITRRHYFDILLLIEDFICKLFQNDENEYAFRMPIGYFSCSKNFNCINDPN